MSAPKRLLNESLNMCDYCLNSYAQCVNDLNVQMELSTDPNRDNVIACPEFENAGYDIKLK